MGVFRRGLPDVIVELPATACTQVVRISVGRHAEYKQWRTNKAELEGLMNLGQVLLLYLMAGSGVAVAVYLAIANCGHVRCCFLLLTAVLFWPLYLPLLLSGRREGAKVGAEAGRAMPAAPPDELDCAIMQVDAELEGALRSLDGWAEEALAREQGRLSELRAAWRAQALRIREMDRLLAQPECPQLDAGPLAISELMRTSQQVIRQNRELLHRVREQTFQDLLGTLAWVRELVSMIHLAKFTGAPASRAEELVAQIAAAVEGLSAPTWQQEAG
jgi:hypothetical protein